MKGAPPIQSRAPQPRAGEIKPPNPVWALPGCPPLPAKLTHRGASPAGVSWPRTAGLWRLRLAAASGIRIWSLAGRLSAGWRRAGWPPDRGSPVSAGSGSWLRRPCHSVGLGGGGGQRGWGSLAISRVKNGVTLLFLLLLLSQLPRSRRVGGPERSWGPHQHASRQLRSRDPAGKSGRRAQGPHQAGF